MSNLYLFEISPVEWFLGRKAAAFQVGNGSVINPLYDTSEDTDQALTIQVAKL